MSDPTGGTGPVGDADEPTLVDHPTSASGVRTRWSRKGPVGDDEVRHSPLVGFMSVPVHRRVPIRRSTLLMAVAFVGLGVLLYFNPAQTTATVTVRGSDGSVYQIPGAVLTSPATTTTTTTTVPPTTTTTTRGPAVPATTGPVFPSTTTTLARGSTTTTSASVGGGAGVPGGVSGSTTTTTGAQVGVTGSTGPTTTGR